MPVFDFNSTPDEKKPAECTYTVIRSNENEATAEKPMMVLDNKICQWDHHSCGVFTNPIKRTSFEFQQEDGTVSADILKIDARFVSLLKWLGENHINVRLSGENTEEGYAVYKIREIAFGGGTKLSAEDGFLQFMIERLLASNAPAEEVDDEDEDEAGDDMKLTSLQSITDFMNCAGRTLPDNIRLWARRNLAVARSHEVSPEERRHAQRALSIMMNVQWKSNYFEAIDPVEARKILDEELEMEKHVRNFHKSLQTLHIGSIAPGPLMVILPQGAAFYPDITITSTVDTEEAILRGLLSDEYGIAILTHPLEDEHFISKKYISEHLNLSVSAIHPAASKNSVSFAEMNGQNFLMYSQVGIR